MSPSDDSLTASERAIDSYLEALLEEPGAMSDGAHASTSERYCMFDVFGLAVAVPEDSVRGEMPCPPLQASPSTPAWLRRAAGGEAGQWIVDLALLTLPGDLSPDQIPLEERCNRVLILEDGDWGVAVEGSTRAAVITTEEVCWRGPQGIRPWLAGTVVEKRCVLLDLDNIRQLGRFGGK